MQRFFNRHSTARQTGAVMKFDDVHEYLGCGLQDGEKYQPGAQIRDAVSALLGYGGFLVSLEAETDLRRKWTIRLPEGGSFSLPGAAWLIFEAFNIELTVIQANSILSAEGSLSAQVKGAPLRFQGTLVTRTSEAGKPVYLWTAQPLHPEGLTFSNLLPADLLAFAGQAKGTIPAGSVIKRVEYAIDPTEREHVFGFVTDVDWTLLEGLALRSLGLYLHISYPESVTVPGAAKESETGQAEVESAPAPGLELRGDLSLERSGKTLTCSARVSKILNDYEFELELKSKNSSPIDAGQIALVLGDFKGSGGASRVPDFFEQKLKACSARELRLRLCPADGSYDFHFDGEVLGIAGTLDVFLFSLFADDPQLSFDLKLKPQPRSIAKTLKWLGLPLEAGGESCLPSMNFALTSLSYWQAAPSFSIGGSMTPGNGETPYELDALLKLRWQSGINCQIALDAEQQPVRLDSLEKDLPFTLDGLKSILTPSMQRKLGATAFRRLKLEIDTREKHYTLGGGVDFLGEFKTNFNLDLSKSGDAPQFTLEVEIEDDLLSLKSLPWRLGIVEEDEAPAWLDQIPDFGLELSKAYLSSKDGLFKLDGGLGVGDGLAEGHFEIQKKDKGVLVEMALKGDEDHPPSLAEAIKQVYGKELPGDLLNLTFGELSFKIDTETSVVELTSRGGASVPLRMGKDEAKLELGADLKYSPKEKLSGKLSGKISLFETAFAASLDLAAQKSALSLELEKGSKLKVKPMVEGLFGEEAFSGLPQELASLLEGLEVNDFHLEIGFAEKPELHLTFGCAASLSLGAGLCVEKATLNLELKARGKETLFTIAIKSKGRLSLPEVGIELSETSLLFSYESEEKKNSWKLAGEIGGKVFGHEGVKLSVSYEDRAAGKEKQRRFVLAYKAAEPLSLEIPNVASLSVSRLDLSISQKSNAAAWELSAAGALRVWNLLQPGASLLDVRGDLSLAHDTTNSLSFKPTEQGAACLRLELPHLEYEGSGGKRQPALSLSLEKLKIVLPSSKKWSFEAASSLSLTGLPDSYPAIELKSSLVFDEKGLTIHYKGSMGTKTNPIILKVSNESIDLGVGYLGVSELTAELTPNDMKLSAVLQIGLPSKLNEPFGKSIYGEAKKGDFNLFRVYIPDRPKDSTKDSTVDFKLGFSVANGLSLSLGSSPFTTPTIEGKRKLVNGKFEMDGKGGYLHEGSDSRKYVYVDLREIGAAGALEFEVPEFRLNTSQGSLNARGGFEIIGDVEIPLTLVERLLDPDGKGNLHLKPIKLRTVPLFQDGKFQVAELKKLFSEAGIDLPKDIAAVLDALVNIFANTFLNKLPERLQNYLNPSIPKGFHFEFAFAPDGSLKLCMSGHGDTTYKLSEKAFSSLEKSKLSAETLAKLKPLKNKQYADSQELLTELQSRLGAADAKTHEESILCSAKQVDPLRVLLPGFPEMLGVELRQLSVGELFAGALFLVEADLRVDLFDLPALLVTMLVDNLSQLDADQLKKLESRDLAGVLEAIRTLAREAARYLTKPQNLQTTFIVEKLVTIVVYQSSIPIPIPLFYDQMGIEYTHPLDLTLQGHIHFPPPTLNLQEIAKAASAFYKFFTDANCLLQDDLLKDFDLRFKANDCFVQLPQAVGGKNAIVIGARGTNCDISAYATLAGALNALKTLTLDKLIGLIPFAYRIGAGSFAYGPFQGSAKYVLLTSSEVANGAYGRHLDKLASAEKALYPAADGLRNLVAGWQINGGLDSSHSYSLVYLAGEFTISQTLSLSGKFGLIATTGNECITGLHLSGSFFNFVAVEIKGAAYLDYDKDVGLSSTKFQIAGEASLLLAGETFFAAKGQMQLGDSLFLAEGSVKAFPSWFPVHGGGRAKLLIEKDKRFQLELAASHGINLFGFELSGDQALSLSIENSGLIFSGKTSNVFGSLKLTTDSNVEIARQDKILVKGKAAFATQSGIPIADGNLSYANNQLKASLDLKLPGLTGHCDAELKGSEFGFRFSTALDLRPVVYASFSTTLSNNGYVLEVELSVVMISSKATAVLGKYGGKVVLGISYRTPDFRFLWFVISGTTYYITLSESGVSWPSASRPGNYPVSSADNRLTPSPIREVELASSAQIPDAQRSLQAIGRLLNLPGSISPQGEDLDMTLTIAIYQATVAEKALDNGGRSQIVTIVKSKKADKVPGDIFERFCDKEDGASTVDKLEFEAAFLPNTQAGQRGQLERLTVSGWLNDEPVPAVRLNIGVPFEQAFQAEFPKKPGRDNLPTPQNLRAQAADRRRLAKADSLASEVSRQAGRMTLQYVHKFFCIYYAPHFGRWVIAEFDTEGKIVNLHGLKDEHLAAGAMLSLNQDGSAIQDASNGQTAVSLNPKGTFDAAQTFAIPLIDVMAKEAIPSIPAELKYACQYTPSSLDERPECPVIRYDELTIIPFSYQDNRRSFGLVAYDARCNPIATLEKPGARYIVDISLDRSAQVIILRGQGSQTVSVSWDELRQMASPVRQIA